MTAEALRRLGFEIERVVAEAGSRGIWIGGGPYVTGSGGRVLLTIVPGSLDRAALAANDPWDLELLATRAVETDDGPATVVIERLERGVPSTELAPPARGVPAFVVDLAARVAAAHAAGRVVGRTEPALVFVSPDDGALAGVAQRPLRAEAAAAKAEGAASLFGVAFLTPGDVRGDPPSRHDDTFRLASMVWRWRHGAEPLAGWSLADRLSHLAGHGPASWTAEHGGRTSAPDTLDSLLIAMLDPGNTGGPSAADLVAELRAMREG